MASQQSQQQQQQQLVVSGFVNKLWDVEGSFKNGFMTYLPDIGVPDQHAETDASNKCRSAIESIAFLLAKHAYKLVVLCPTQSNVHYLHRAPNAIVINKDNGNQFSQNMHRELAKTQEQHLSY